MTSIKSLPTARVRSRRYGYQMGLRDLHGLDSRFTRPHVHDGATLAEARRERQRLADKFASLDAQILATARAMVWSTRQYPTGGAR